MKKTEKILMRLFALALCLPLLFTAAFSFAAMADESDPFEWSGEYILEDPALIADVSEDMGDVEPSKDSAEPENSVEPSTTQQATESPAETPTPTPTDTTEQPTTVPTTNPTQAPSSLPTEAPAVSYEIALNAPSGWYKTRAVMEVAVQDIGGTGWANIKIVLGGKTLIDGPLPSGHVWLDLLENCTVEVIVTDPYGESHRESAAVNCIDSTRPTLKASVKDEYLLIEASDAQSGVAAVQVNGTLYTQLTNGALKIHLKEYADAYEQLLVQAVDKVGNVSKAIAVANPFFHGTPSASPTATAKPTQKPTATPKPTKKPSGNGSSGNAHSTSTSGSGTTPTPVPTSSSTPAPIASLEPTETLLPVSGATMPPVTISAGSPFTSGGNAYTRDLLYDRFTNKQFIAVETRGGDVLYMVIDYDKPLDEAGERYETYFLNLVDSRDLTDIVGEIETQEREPEIIYLTPEPTAVPTAAPAVEQPAKQEDKSGALIGIAAIAALAGGGALWYFKFSKAKNAKPMEPDYAFDDEEEEEEAVNEDGEEDA